MLDNSTETPAYQVASISDLLHRAIIETFTDVVQSRDWWNGDVQRILDNIDEERLAFMCLGGLKTSLRSSWEEKIAETVYLVNWYNLI